MAMTNAQRKAAQTSAAQIRKDLETGLANLKLAESAARELADAYACLAVCKSNAIKMAERVEVVSTASNLRKLSACLDSEYAKSLRAKIVYLVGKLA